MAANDNILRFPNRIAPAAPVSCPLPKLPNTEPETPEQAAIRRQVTNELEALEYKARFEAMNPKK